MSWMCRAVLTTLSGGTWLYLWLQEEEAKAQEKANAAKAIKDECEADLAVVGGKALAGIAVVQYGHRLPCAGALLAARAARLWRVAQPDITLVVRVLSHAFTHLMPYALQAIPILNDALAALDTIKEADINYIKKLGNPPAAIKLVGIDAAAGCASKCHVMLILSCCAESALAAVVLGLGPGPACCVLNLSCMISHEFQVLEAVCVTLDVKPAKIKDDSGKMVGAEFFACTHRSPLVGVAPGHRHPAPYTSSNSKRAVGPTNPLPTNQTSTTNLQTATTARCLTTGSPAWPC